MTDLQLRYWGLQEDKRHNLVHEQETERYNTAQIELGWQKAATDARNASANETQAAAAWKRAVTDQLVGQAQQRYYNAQAEGKEQENRFYSDTYDTRVWDYNVGVGDHTVKFVDDMIDTFRNAFGTGSYLHNLFDGN